MTDLQAQASQEGLMLLSQECDVPLDAVHLLG